MTSRKNTPWSNEEVQTFLGLVADERIQRELDGATRNQKIYQEVSQLLAAYGYQRSFQQCREKLKKLKSVYRYIRDQNGISCPSRRTWRWFGQMDAIYGHGPSYDSDWTTASLESPMEDASPAPSDFPGASTHVPSSMPTPPIFLAEHLLNAGSSSILPGHADCPPSSTSATSTALQSPIKDTSLGYWSKTEAQALLTLWADPLVQEDLLLNVKNEQVYARLSARLASLGFNKAPKQCRDKIKNLKKVYKRIKNGQQGNQSDGSRASVWFAIMDDVLSPRAAADHQETTEPLLPSQSDVGVETEVETEWLSDEVQVLMTLWAQSNIQEDLLSPATNDQAFAYLSNELALVGFNKTADQCRHKVNSLIQEYKQMKKAEPHMEVQSEWFAILDCVIGGDGEAYTAVDSPGMLAQPKSPEDENMNKDDLHRTVWTADEVRVLLTRWAEESVQEQLTSSQRNERVFALLSSELATHGFDKTTSQCRSKISKLKQQYKMVKERNDYKRQKSRWFAIMDKVLGGRGPESKSETALATDSQPASLESSQHEPVETKGGGLSLSSLCLLVPTLRVMCAFAWQVVQHCNVAHYGKVEELVTMVTELAPELLTPREKMQVLLKLRARCVLELCRSESTAKLLTLQPHLTVIQNLKMASSCDQEEFEEFESSKSNFVEVVHMLLQDPERRARFFKDAFPVHYGKQYEATLNALVWKLISRLDNLLPVPDIKQTAEWLGTSPAVMEECEKLVLEPHKLKALVQFHQQLSGGTNKRNSEAHYMFLPKLCLPRNAKLLIPEHISLNSSEHRGSCTELDDDDDDEGLLDFSEDEERGQTVKDSGNLKLKDGQSSRSPPAARPQTSPAQLHPKERTTDGVPPQVKSEIYTPETTSATHTPEYCGKYLPTCNNSRQTPPLPFQCDKCEKRYASKFSLKAHHRTHTGERPYLCSHCGRGFTTSNSLRMHVRIHTGDRRYKCDICGKTSVQHLARHMRMHRGEKNYLCPECGKAFLSSAELRLHTRFHTGERPYTCKHCGKGFIAKCLLTVHMRQHTRENPYKCSLCPKTFPTLRAQKKHTVIHFNKKSFQCSKCGKIFRVEDYFKMHLESHK